MYIHLDYLNKIDNLFKYELVEEKISKFEEHKVNIGINGHAIFESVNYQHLPVGIYKIISQRVDGIYINSVDFIFNGAKQIERPFNLIFWSYVNGEIKVDLDKQVIAISAHSSHYHHTLKVRLYRMI